MGRGRDRMAVHADLDQRFGRDVAEQVAVGIDQEGTFSPGTRAEMWV